MREIKEHRAGNDLDDQIIIEVADEPGAGGASHEYELYVNGEEICHISFQNGPVKECSPNGVSQEALLAVVIDRLRSFQAGPLSCRENAIALTKCEEALHWLQARTRNRIARGVEGRTQQ